MVVLQWRTTVNSVHCLLLPTTAYHIVDTSRHKHERWCAMYHKMSNELPGTALPARFIMYNQYLTSLRFLLAR